MRAYRGPPMGPSPSRRNRYMHTRERSFTSLYGNRLHAIVDALQSAAGRATCVGYPSASPSTLPAYDNEVTGPLPTAAVHGGG